ncbi:MAG: HPr(Ser) kinase/phosphatase [Oscillospiraceae bacterium]|nr:HPr(Ser) kinase/phosphatase [Oscillospiraceae bacterium]
MDENYSAKLGEVADEFALTPAFLPNNWRDIDIVRSDINRPGLPLSGFFEYFEPQRIQIIGNVEYRYLETLDPEIRYKSLDTFLARHPVCLIFSNDHRPYDDAVELAKKYGIPVFTTPEATTQIMAAIIASLNVKLAPRITRHGVLVEVYGEGLLILGDSGVGKSETAIELVKRGHRLIADDAVEIKKVSAKTLVGSAPELIRHYIELRGIGIVDVRRIFGMGAIKLTEKIDLVINLELWQQGKFYDRFGMDTEYIEIMGINVPAITIPVKPGRNLAIILEIAAMNNRQKKMGYNTAIEFNKKLMGQANVDNER